MKRAFAWATVFLILLLGTSPGFAEGSARLDSFDQLPSLYSRGSADITRQIVVYYRKPQANQVAALNLRQRQVSRGESVSACVDVIEIAPGEDREAILDALRQNPNVQAADCNQYLQAFALPNDPGLLSGNEWYFTKIGADSTWDSVNNTGNPVVIAVIDTGLDTAHPEFSNRRTIGYDYMRGVTDMIDLSGHGTSVAGCAVAVTNNGVGIAGVSGTADVKVAPYRIGGNYEGDVGLTVSGAVAALDEIRRNRSDIRVVNMSFGTDRDNSTLRAAIENAVAAGLTLVASAGNYGEEFPCYPAAYNDVISVAATTLEDEHASFSQYNDTVDLSAPGVNILTTYLMGRGSWNGDYKARSGTSFSSPIVAACCALLLAKYPTLDALEVENVLRATALDLGEHGWDPYFGAGRVRLDRALSYSFEKGRLTLQNVVEGENRSFTFVFKCSTVGQYPYAGSKSGAIGDGGQITLRGGESVTISDIPYGAVYSLIELEADQFGYRTSALNNLSSISTADQTATFTNVKAVVPVSPPATGDGFPMAQSLCAAFFALFAAVWAMRAKAGAKR